MAQVGADQQRAVDSLAGTGEEAPIPLGAVERAAALTSGAGHLEIGEEDRSEICRQIMTFVPVE